MEPNETMLETVRRHLEDALAGFSTRERALADAVARAFHNAAKEMRKGPEPSESAPDNPSDPTVAAPTVPGSAT